MVFKKIETEIANNFGGIVYPHRSPIKKLEKKNEKQIVIMLVEWCTIITPLKITLIDAYYAKSTVTGLHKIHRLKGICLSNV